MSATSGAGKRVDVVLLYQSLLGAFGDRGNATVVVKRLAWRGYQPVLTMIEPGDPVPDTGNIYLLGGGEGRNQVAAVKALQADGAIHRAAAAGAAIFAVCGGYQMLGHTFAVGPADQTTPGLGLLDITTTPGPQRAIGELLSRWLDRDGEEQWITGFETHAGQTRLGSGVRPVGQVVAGTGNGDGTDGAQSGNIVGIYPHGPALARNPALADHLLEMALDTSLPALNLPELAELREQRIGAARR